LFKKERTRPKSPSPDGTEAELAADPPAALVPPDTGEAAEGEGIKAGRVRTGGLLPDGGEGIPDAPLNGNAASPVLAEAAGQDRSAGDDRPAGLRDLPVGELSQYAAEDLPSGTPGSDRNARPPLRGAADRDGRVRDRRRERFNPEGNTRAGLDKETKFHRDGAEGVRAEAGKTEEASRAGSGETDLVVDLRSMGKTQAEISVERENRPVQSFQNMLARELHENLNGDIVRHASVMLRDGGEGTIRLSLRPETLGSVKIRLEITENKITGRIIVESSEAFKAFEQELHSLEQSFRDSGFDGANLEMAFASGGEEGRREGEADSLFFGRRAALRYDAALSGVSESPEEGRWLGIRADSQGRPLVNMLV
jgi:hypothetical protein